MHMCTHLHTYTCQNCAKHEENISELGCCYSFFKCSFNVEPLSWKTEAESSGDPGWQTVWVVLLFPVWEVLPLLVPGCTQHPWSPLLDACHVHNEQTADWTI